MAGNGKQQIQVPVLRQITHLHFSVDVGKGEDGVKVLVITIPPGEQHVFALAPEAARRISRELSDLEVAKLAPVEQLQ